MRKLKIAEGALWVVCASIAIIYMAVTTVGLVADRSGAQTFYAPEIDATCIESFERGRTAMFCFRGDLRKEARQ